MLQDGRKEAGQMLRPLIMRLCFRVACQCVCVRVCALRVWPSASASAGAGAGAGPGACWQQANIKTEMQTKLATERETTGHSAEPANVNGAK